MATLWILLQLADDKRIESVEPEPHVGRASGHIDARGCAQTQHRATPVRERQSAVSARPRRNRKIQKCAARLPTRPVMRRAALCASQTSRQTRPAPAATPLHCEAGAWAQEHRDGAPAGLSLIHISEPT